MHWIKMNQINSNPLLDLIDIFNYFATGVFNKLWRLYNMVLIKIDLSNLNEEMQIKLSEYSKLATIS